MTLARLLLKTLLLSANRRHLQQGRPRLVGYAFDHITAKIHIDGRFEDRELTALERFVFPHLPANGICLDIGANIGNHAVAFAGHFRKIHAFEPNPKVFRVLDINAGLRSNITAWNFGLSEAEATVEVVENQLNLGGTGIGRTDATFAGDRVAFSLRRLDDLDLLAEGDRITFVKIDVEGHEPAALNGARATLAAHRPLVAMEIDRSTVSGGTSPALSVLRDIGYAHFYEIASPRGAARLFGASAQIVPVAGLSARNYPLFLASVTPLSFG